MKTYTAPQGISVAAEAILKDAGLEPVPSYCDPDMEWVRVKPPVTDARVICSPTTGRTHLRDIHLDVCSGKVKLFTLSDIDQDLLKTIRSTSVVAIGLLINIMRLNNVCRETNKPGTCIQGKKFLVTDPLGRVAEHIRQEMIVKQAEETTRVSQADIIFLSERYTGTTSRLFNTEWQWPGKNGVFVVNTSRSDLVDRDVLISHIRGGYIAGYAEDITGDDMPMEFFDACETADASFHFSGHLGGFAKESLAKVETALARVVVEAMQ